jgi:uncharacterized protein (TIGR03437 family)
MRAWKRIGWCLFLTVLFLLPVLLVASVNGTPLGRTGAFGEPGCDGFGCHRNEPLPPGSGRVVLEVGPYVPGQTQRVQVRIFDTNARRWGFQLAARERRDPSRQAGSFTAGPDDSYVRVRCANGNEPPCGAGLEYVTHTSVGTRVNTFAVSWTAPATDVGEVIFTVAAVGADGDQGTNGDRSYTTQVLSLYAPSNQPALREGGVVSAASFQAPAGAVARGALVSLFGEKLAPPGFQREVTREDLTTDGRLPLELNRLGADLLIPNADAVPAYILFVSERQMNIQIPALPAGFSGRLDVQPVFNRGRGSNEVRGNRVGVTVLPAVPALFTFPGGRYAAAVHSAVPAGAPVGPPGLFANSRPARPGEVILVFGTGFGPTQPPVEPGALAAGAAPLTGTLSARIGGLNLASADILYAGAAPGFAGLQQFNLRIPVGLGSGDLPILLGVVGLETQAGVMLRVEP